MLEQGLDVRGGRRVRGTLRPDGAHPENGNRTDGDENVNKARHLGLLVGQIYHLELQVPRPISPGAADHRRRGPPQSMARAGPAQCGELRRLGEISRAGSRLDPDLLAFPLAQGLLLVGTPVVEQARRRCL